MRMHPALEKERMTVHAMIRIYCRANHGSKTMCHSCAALRDYADRALERCPYAEEKPTCANCPIHCYSKENREKVREVMRYAGPRMLFRHPIMAIRHVRHGKKKVPVKPARR